MAQIFGIYCTNGKHDLASILSCMGELMRRPTQGPAQTWCLQGAQSGLGAVLDKEYGELITCKESDSGCGMVIDGRLTSHNGTEQKPLERVLSAYVAKDVDFVNELRGSFSLALCDTKKKRLICVTDRVSTRSLYWVHLPGWFAFGTETKALLALPNVNVHVDPEAIAAYLTYGRIFGTRTLWKNVHRLRPGSILVYDAHQDTVQEGIHWRPEDEILQRRLLEPDRREALSAAFRRAVLLGCPDSGQMGLSLSGGLDSRGILAVLAAEKKPVCLRTEGVAGCVDERVASQLAKQTGYPWRFNPLQTFDITQYVESMRRYVYLTEGMMVPEGYPGISALRFSLEENLVVLQRGHGGENARLSDAWPYQVRDEALTLKSVDELCRLIEPSESSVELGWLNVFADPQIREAIEHPSDTYRSFISKYNLELSPAEILSLMYLHINEACSVAAYRNSLRGYADMAVPYVEDEFLELVLSTGVAHRRDSTIHHDLIRSHCPDLMKIANSNNGAPLDASRWRLFVTDKFQSLMRRISLPGFRHYHNVEAWIRSRLRESVRSLLMEPRTLQRGVFNSKGLDSILNDPTRPGNSRLLARLVMLEMWFRLFVDREIVGYQLNIDKK